MNDIHYIGFDVHKKTIAYCVKTADGQIVDEGKVQAQRLELRQWAKRRQVAVARSDGGDAVQWLDLRHVETVCPGVGDGPSGHDEGHHGGQEEERLYRCTYYCRHGAVQSVA